MKNYEFCDFDEYCNGSSNCGTTCGCLDNIINDVDLEDLANAVNDNTDAINSNYANNQFSYCDLFNILLCYGSQFINLIYLLLFLYWWSNQSIYCFLMNQNCQLTNGVSDLLSQCCQNNSKK